MLQIENYNYNMQEFIPRNIESFVFQNLEIFPAIAILGPRQCGKSTFIKMMAKKLPSFLYLDLQSFDDFNKLSEPTLFFEANKDATICLDEIQLVPHLFSVLRSVIDQNRRNGRFILLGSASRNLIQHSAESLAGRIGFITLTPFLINEVSYLPTFNLRSFWLRGGYPDSYLSMSDENSKLWLENFIRTYIERDIPQFGFQIPALQLRRLLTMCAHNQGQQLNASKLGESMQLSHPTIRHYIDILEQTFILRTLMPYTANVKKRLVKAPKVYVRDSGILHRLLSIDTYNDLIGNPVFGASWEGLVVENIIQTMSDWQPFYYRTASGDEMDLVMVKGDRRIAIECKASSAPQLSKGFWNAVQEIKPEITFVIAPIQGKSYPICENVFVISLEECVAEMNHREQQRQ